MNILYLIIFFILGLFMGSFYTVIGLRLPNHENFITNRSYCDKCHHEVYVPQVNDWNVEHRERLYEKFGGHHGTS